MVDPGPKIATLPALPTGLTSIRDPLYYIAVIACAIAIQRAPLTQTALATQVSIKDAANKRRSRLYHRIVHQDAVGPRLYSAAVKIKASNSPTFFCQRWATSFFDGA